LFLGELDTCATGCAQDSFVFIGQPFGLARKVYLYIQLKRWNQLLREVTNYDVCVINDGYRQSFYSSVGQVFLSLLVF
jgi:hypothetical protein